MFEEIFQRDALTPSSNALETSTFCAAFYFVAGLFYLSKVTLEYRNIFILK